MKNWREKMNRGDIAEAAKRAGIHPNHYSLSCKTAPENWSPAMIKINTELKKLIEEREEQRAQFINN